MSQMYKVKQGDYLAKIATMFGFKNLLTIYDHPKNAQLKQKRPNPNILFPGDMLFIPDLGEKKEARATGSLHSFQLPTSTVKLRVALLDVNDEPIANAECRVGLGPHAAVVTADGSGRFERDVQVTGSHVGTLEVQDPNLPFVVEMGLKVGHLDPVEEVSGQKARLNNLGYSAGPLDSDDADRFKSAVEEFQCNQHLVPIDGICGSRTQAKLKEVHGC